MIVFVNCHEEMAVGMRILASMAAVRGFAVHLVVMRGYAVAVSDHMSAHTLHKRWEFLEKERGPAREACPLSHRFCCAR